MTIISKVFLIAIVAIGTIIFHINNDAFATGAMFDTAPCGSNKNGVFELRVTNTTNKTFTMKAEGHYTGADNEYSDLLTNQWGRASYTKTIAPYSGPHYWKTTYGNGGCLNLASIYLMIENGDWIYGNNPNIKCKGEGSGYMDLNVCEFKIIKIGENPSGERYNYDMELTKIEAKERLQGGGSR